MSEKVVQATTEAKKTGGELPSQAAATAILDAAERRIRTGGYDGFSFREIAADVGVKSSSVHYHFPTKEQLAAAVVRRYSDAVAADIERGYAREKNPAKVWVQLFRSTLRSEKRMCPCVVLGASSIDLPDAVASEVRRFFSMCLEKLTSAGFTPDAARHVLSTITGALVTATALRDLAAYDRATRALIEDGLDLSPRRPR
jgi:TetR/AcrR family transcriptional repressor of nem operon